ncbi:MAG: hypothetical protein FWG21_05805 [Oscillospiraceae bacterium]|nr:hypothetical protein [Oscillospiraceae bacterium]
MLKKILSVVLVMIMLFSIAGCSMLNSAATAETYEIGDDILYSVYSIVGERKVTGVESGTSNGAPTKKYTYSSPTVVDDLLEYFTYLMRSDWVLVQDYNLNVMPGSAQFAKNSLDTGKVLLMTISFENQKYSIHLTKIEGSITLN